MKNRVRRAMKEEASIPGFTVTHITREERDSTGRLNRTKSVNLRMQRVEQNDLDAGSR